MEIALAYAEEYEKGSACFQADKETAIYWYETALSNDPNNATAKEKLEAEFGQPPSGGCVLKHQVVGQNYQKLKAATFGWLCVETFCHNRHRLFLASSHLRVAVC